MFVQRNEFNKVSGLFRQQQPGMADEELPDDHPEVLAYLNPPQVIRAVTMRQARLALLDSGKLLAVEAAVSQVGGAAQIEWEYAAEVRRDWPLVAQVAAAVGMTEADLDALFELAAKK